MKVELVVVPDSYEKYFRITIDDIIHMIPHHEATKLANTILDEGRGHTAVLPEDEILRVWREHRGQYGYGLRWIARRFNTSHMTIKRILEKHNARP